MASFAVVGHVEWVHFVRVARLPRPGEIALAKESWAEAAGGGAMTALEIARLVDGTDDRAIFFTAVGDDDTGARARAELGKARSLRVDATIRAATAHPVVFTQLTDDRERTITVLSPPLGPSGTEPLPWQDLAGCAAVYFCKGDAAAVRAARQAPILIATARASAVLDEADVDIDVLVLSKDDDMERTAVAAIRRRPALLVTTDGARGGSWAARDGASGRWEAAVPPGKVADSYGAGDSFAGGLTVGLGRGRSLDDALAIASRSGAAALCRAGGNRR